MAIRIKDMFSLNVWSDGHSLLFNFVRNEKRNSFEYWRIKKVVKSTEGCKGQSISFDLQMIILKNVLNSLNSKT